jgi:DNA-binding XRE family transcriptional regulator
MIRAYDELYLDKARVALGRMLDYAVYDLNYSLADFWACFLKSPIITRFERGEPSIVVGKSGVELVYEILGYQEVSPTYSINRSKEYWTGWAIAYFQWQTGLSFQDITNQVSIDEICSLYSPYHEMDIRQFCDKMCELYKSRKRETNLKKFRIAVGYSQSELAKETGIPLRTIQQYEQGQKNINKAQAEYVIKLSRALYCDPYALLELI